MRLFCLLCFSASNKSGFVEAMPSTAARPDMSITLPAVSIYAGLAAHYITRADVLMDNRLSTSSMRTVNRAVTLWNEVRTLFNWEELVLTGDPERGGKLASFVIYMVDNHPELVYDSINSYVWGFRWYVKLQHQADPIIGVINWHDFMQSVKVVTWVPHEPRREVPLELLRRMIQAADINVFWEVQTVFICLVLLFSFSRSECPCPKTHTGEGSFNRLIHWQMRDFIIRMVDNCGHVLVVRMKGYKQDPRIERPEARGEDPQPGQSRTGGNDLVHIGDVPDDPDFSVFRWLRLLLSFYPAGRDPSVPMFLGREMMRPLLYSGALSDFRRLLGRVTNDIAYGLHGLRVKGYNLAVAGAGGELAKAHGGWKSGACHRYQRFAAAEVGGLAAAMMGATNPYAAPPAARAVVRDPSVARGRLANDPPSGRAMAEAAAAAAAAPVVPAAVDLLTPQGSPSAAEAGPPAAPRGVPPPSPIPRTAAAAAAVSAAAGVLPAAAPVANPATPSGLPSGTPVLPLVTGVSPGVGPPFPCSSVATGAPVAPVLDGRLAADAAALEALDSSPDFGGAPRAHAAFPSPASSHGSHLSPSALAAASAFEASLSPAAASAAAAFAASLARPLGSSATGGPSVPTGSLVGLPVAAPPPQFGHAPPSGGTRSRRRAARPVTRSARGPSSRA